MSEDDLFPQVKSFGREWGVVYIVELSEELEISFTGWSEYRIKQSAQYFAELWKRVGPFEVIRANNAIPVEVASAGKPEICAYLFSIHKMTYEMISNSVGVKEDTVKQYLTDFKRGRR